VARVARELQDVPLGNAVCRSRVILRSSALLPGNGPGEQRGLARDWLLFSLFLAESRLSRDARKKVPVPFVRSHEGKFKVLLTLTHRGSTAFRDLAISFPVESAVQSGKKTTQRPEFSPGEVEAIELID
jgi:hypothetical protein